MSTSSPSLEQLKRAIAISEEIDALKEELSRVLSGDLSASITTAAYRVGNGKAPKAVKVKSGKRTLSPEARERIIAAQKARWAKVRGEKSADAVPIASKSKPAKKGKRVVSEEARARMAASARARWAKKK